MRLPAGVRDWLPEELERKREIEQRVRGVFDEHGYLEVETPSIERFDTLLAGLGERVADRTFRFDDRRGSVLALRPEMTTSIARLVSTRMRDRLPLRLSYIARAFRYEEPQEGRMREFTQAGVEYIGAAEREADAEALFTAIETLDQTGLTSARFDINHVAVIDGILATFSLTAERAFEVKQLLSDRNLVALDERLRDLPAEVRATIRKLALTRGGYEMIEMLARHCNDGASREGLDRLTYLLDYAKDQGIVERISIDPTLLRGQGYYTGLVFEGYVRELGFPLCGGGRYDGLLPRFGLDAAAVGWTTGIERLLNALERNETA